METVFDILYLVAGGGLLYLGAEWLVKGSAGLARSLGVAPLIIGLTVVAYGTSAPELAVSTAAILEDSSALVLGNVIGSCIANLGLILGITALLAPPTVDPRLIRREIPVLLLSVAVVPLALWDGTIVMWEAVAMVGVAVAFTGYTLFVASSESALTGHEDEPAGEPAPKEDEDEAFETSRLKQVGFTIVGLALLILGGEIFVDGAKGVALTLGMSEHLVGLTVVAVGTSLPEMAASLIAAVRGYSSLAVGNVVGSNIFNVFLILGVVGVIRPIQGSTGAIPLDLGMLVGITLLGVLLMRGARRINRFEGLLLVMAYVGFIVVSALES